MVMKVLHRKLARDLWRMRGQALAVALVVLSGTASYITVASAYRNLLLTRDTYYDQYRFADFFIKIERAPLSAVERLAALPNVRRAEGRIVQDVTVDAGGDDPRTGRISSLPDRPDHALNGIYLATGRYFRPGALNEVIVSDSFADANHLRLGDTIEATVESRKHRLRVVGTALSPEYVYMIRSAQELMPDPERFGILWVSRSFAEMAFDMDGACNDIVGTVADAGALDRTLEQAEKLLKPYGVFAKFKAEDQISNRFLSDEITGLGVSARVTPTLFLGVAAMILFVLLNRMVRQERTQIGLLKAYGHTNLGVALHYVQYALVLGVAGCAGGAIVGQFLSRGLVQLYVKYYSFPVLRSQVFPDVMVSAFAITVAFSTLGAVAAAWKAATIEPAEAMRPQAPRYGHRTLIEFIPALWRRVGFIDKMIFRNIARYRFRAGLSVFGLLIASALLLVGFFTMDSLRYMISFQFERVQREDVRVALEREVGKAGLYELGRFANVRQAEPVLQYPFEAVHGWRTKDIGITGLPQNGELLGLINTAGQPIDVGPGGLVLGSRLAEDLGVAPGDVVRLKPLMGRITSERDVAVTQVVQQYFGSGAYMNIDALSRLLDEPFAMNAALLRMDPGTGRELGRRLKDYPGVAAVDIKEDARAAIENTLEESMGIMNGMLTFFAGLIAFSIIYNSTMVSLMERQRELASLRVLGLSVQEVGSILYRENTLLAVIGIALGIPAGMGLSRLLVTAYDTELYRLPFYIAPKTYMLTVGLSLLFVVLANLAVRRRIQRLDLVEVLKERE